MHLFEIIYLVFAVYSIVGRKNVNGTVNTAISAWIEAGQQLHIRVETPFKLKKTDGTNCIFHVYLPDFGCINGVVLLFAIPPNLEYERDDVECAKMHGYFYSICNQESYSSFDWDFFVATLNDFGYYGDPEERPSWYTGTPWRH